MTHPNPGKDTRELKDIHAYLPPSLALKLKRMAKRDCRSISQQATYLLAWALRRAQ